MNSRKKLIWCLVSNLALLISVITIIFIFASESKYFRIGPHTDLIVISVKINTSVRYILLLTFIAFLQGTKVLIEEMGMPVLGFNIYNPDKNIITEFHKNELQFFGNAMFAISNIRYIFEIMVTITQIDIALFAVLIAQVTSIVTIRILLNEKIFLRDKSYKIEAEKLVCPNDRDYELV